jgi:hypothetical protein
MQQGLSASDQNSTARMASGQRNQSDQLNRWLWIWASSPIQIIALHLAGYFEACLGLELSKSEDPFDVLT